MKSDAWTKKEICELFSTVEKFKKDSKPLLHAFTLFAQKYARKRNSVRNFYYNQLKIFETSPKLCKEMNINIENHKKIEQKFFTKEECDENMTKIKNLLQKGYSVRKACFEVAHGDANNMLRLQNKFHSEKHAQKLQQEKKVLFMPSRNPTLSDTEINSLFLGLVKLVKKSAEENAEYLMLNKVQSANAELRKSIKEIAEKEKEVKILQQKFELLSNEKLKLTEELQSLRAQNIELLKDETNSTKLRGLKNYLKNNKSNEMQTKN